MPIPVLSGVGDLLDAYQRNLADPFSGTILQGLNKAKMGLGLGDQGSSVLDQLDPKSAMDYAYQDNPLGRFAYSTATDPLNLVGVGLPEKLAATGLLKGIPLADKALRGAGFLDHLPGQIGGNAIGALGDAAGAVANPLAAGLAPGLARFGTAHPDLAQGWQDTTRAWKALQHMVPGYPAMTSTDDLTLMAANGQMAAAGGALKGLPGAVKNGYLGSGTTDMGSASALASEMGWGELPHAISDAGVPGSWAGISPTDTSSVFSKWQTQVPTGRYLPSGDPEMAPTVNGPKDWVLDRLAALDRKSKNVEQQTELTKRGNLYGEAYKQAVAPDVEMTANKLEGYGRSGLAQDLRDSQGIYSPSKLLSEMQAAGAGHAELTDVIGHPPTWSGSDIGLAPAYEDGWAGAVERAGGLGDSRIRQLPLQGYATPGDPNFGRTFGFGERTPEHDVHGNIIEPSAAHTTNSVLYRYSNNPVGDFVKGWTDEYGGLPGHLDPRTAGVDDLRAAGVTDPLALEDWKRGMTDARSEEVLRGLAQSTFGGYKFASQNVPAFAKLATAHPVLANAPAQYYRDSDIYGAQHGLPASYHGQMPIGHNPLNGDQIFFNPAGLSSMAELIGGLSGSDGGGQSGIGGLIDTVGKIGLGVNPLVKTAAQITGQLGNNQESDVLRPLTALSGAASLLSGQPVDLEQPLHSLVAGAEQGLTGRETFPYQDYLLRKRTGELSADHGQWSATQTTGPAHDAAVTDTAHRLGVSDLLRTLTPFDVQMLSPEAAAIGHNDRTAQLYGLRGMQRAAATNPTAQVYSLADPLAEKVARFQTLPYAEQQALIRDPRAMEMLQQQRSLQLHNPQSLTAG